MLHAFRTFALIAILVGASFALPATGCAWWEKHGADVVKGIGCAVGIARDIAGAVHAGPARTWLDVVAGALSQADDPIACGVEATKIARAEHACAGADGAACDTMPAEEQQRLREVEAMGRMAARMRARSQR